MFTEIDNAIETVLEIWYLDRSSMLSFIISPLNRIKLTKQMMVQNRHRLTASTFYTLLQDTCVTLAQLSRRNGEPTTTTTTTKSSTVTQFNELSIERITNNRNKRPTFIDGKIGTSHWNRHQSAASGMYSSDLETIYDVTYVFMHNANEPGQILGVSVSMA